MTEPSLPNALDRAVRRLIELRGLERHRPEDRADHWEGEDVWNPMLAAQYAIAMHVMERPLTPERRRSLVQQLRAEQLPNGGWGLHPHGGESLFVTTLVYVAARTLGVSADDPMLAFARELFRREDVRAIASWGKAWLSIANLYGWEGVNAVPPEAWLMPTSSPLHPANYYCHTRLIYMGMASVYGLKLRARRTPLVDELRQELYAFHAKDDGRGGRTVDYEAIDFAGAKGLLREKDLWAPPSAYLSAMYRAVNLYEAAQKKLGLGAIRRRCLASIRERMRWELRSTDYTCLSPVNGLLFALTLHAWDRNDPDVEKQLARFEGWVWEDEKHGARVAGARSATWDSSFALQALSSARPLLSRDTRALCDDAIRTGLGWLRTQQIQAPVDDAATYRAQYRLDPTGGFCFAGVWHGWPVSDCTAEALCAFLEAPEEVHAADPRVIEAGVRFLLQCQNPDGGFGSYEARKQRFTLEWMNPAEMFGDSMTELSYVECTASNLVALCHVRRRFGSMLRDGLSARVDRAIARAEKRLRNTQKADGSWPGAWGICFVYGTMFGVRGLIAAGASKDDPAVRRACEFVRAQQRADGSWGEHWKSCLEDRYSDLGHGHVTQTAWALLTLLEADDPQADDAIVAGSAWLASMQLPNGDFPVQEFAGVFFRTALIEYRLYRRFFPVWALALAAKRLGAQLSHERGPEARAFSPAE
jgi:lanosterol synthase